MRCAPRCVTTMSLRVPTCISATAASNSLPHWPGLIHPRSAWGVFNADLQSDFSRANCANLAPNVFGLAFCCNASNASKSSCSASCCVRFAGAERRACASESEAPANFNKMWARRILAGFPGSLGGAVSIFRFFASGCLDRSTAPMPATISSSTLIFTQMTPTASPTASLLSWDVFTNRRLMARGRQRCCEAIFPICSSDTPRAPSVSNVRHDAPCSNFIT
mmetsp:Transcript_100239/g.282816  ORF Transcript_100239/g.282816 Transcript_100239/m.282816 type:complete len:221 (-) Transcript_100239:245-907(-)